MTHVRCLDDRHGRPLCGATAAGSLLVDKIAAITCTACHVIGAARCELEHELIRDRRLEGDNLAPQVDDDGALMYEQANCPCCTTTICLLPLDARGAA